MCNSVDISLVTPAFDDTYPAFNMADDFVATLNWQQNIVLTGVAWSVDMNTSTTLLKWEHGHAVKDLVFICQSPWSVFLMHCKVCRRIKLSLWSDGRINFQWTRCRVCILITIFFRVTFLRLCWILYRKSFGKRKPNWKTYTLSNCFKMSIWRIRVTWTRKL